MRKERQVNYELLRIIAMMMIITLHYLSKGGALSDPKESLSATGYAAWIIEAFCLVAVNVYVLISGYFGTDTGKQDKALFSVRKPVKIWLRVLFYSAIIGIIAMITGIQDFDIYTLFTYIFPTVTEHYWFATSYLLLCLFMPFLNAGLDRLDKKGLQRILLMMFVVFSLAKSVIPMHLPWDKLGYDVLWFVFLYLTGAYLKKYGMEKIAGHRAFLIYCLCAVITILSMLFIRKLYLDKGILGDFINYAYSYNHVFTYFGAIGLFGAFKNVMSGITAENCKSGVTQKICRLITTVSPATFGVYLIHEHINLRYLWPQWFNCKAAAGLPVGLFILHFIGTVIAVYSVCTLIDIIVSKAESSVKRLT